MKQLLLLSLLCGSAAIFSMKEEGILFSTKHYRNCKERIGRCDDYDVYELTTKENINNLSIPNKRIYGEIKKNSVISVLIFPFPNANEKEVYGLYSLRIMTDNKTLITGTKGEVKFACDYNQRAKENDSYEAPLFHKLRDDLATFKKNNLEKVNLFFNLKNDIKQDLLNTVFIAILDESPKIVFPNAYHQQKACDLIEQIYKFSRNNNSLTLKHF